MKKQKNIVIKLSVLLFTAALALVLGLSFASAAKPASAAAAPRTASVQDKPEISYTYERDNLITFHVFSIYFSAQSYVDISATAATMPNGAKRWTLTEYFNAVKSAAEFDSVVIDGDAASGYLFTLSISYGTTELTPYFNYALPSERKRNFFLNKYTHTQNNPYLFFTPAYTQKDSLIDILRNGKGTLPAFYSCFPDMPAFDTLPASFYMLARTGMNTDGTKVDDLYNSYYYWEGTPASLKEETVTFSYYQANSLGWNILTLLIASAVVLIVFLLTKNSTKRPVLLNTQPRRRPVPNMRVGDIDVFGVNNPNQPPPTDIYGNPVSPPQGNYPRDIYGNPIFPPQGFETPEQKRERARRELDEIFGSSDTPQDSGKDKDTDNDDSNNEG